MYIIKGNKGKVMSRDGKSTGTNQAYINIS